MSSAAAPAAAGAEGEAPPAKGGKKKLVILAVPVVLAAVGAGLWFGGILPPLLGMGGDKAAHGEAKPEHGKAAASKPEHGKPVEGKSGEGKSGEGKAAEAKSGEGKKAEGKAGEGKKTEGKAAEGKAGEGGNAEAADDASADGSFVDIPDIIANLNNGNRKATYVKLHARLELADPEDRPAVKAAMPRLLDLFQTYLREMRPEELRGSAGTYRLREELISRANVALTPARVTDVLFTELLIQ